MVEVHVLDAWLAPAAPATPWPFGLFAGTWITPRVVLDMIGGLAAPGFLYMAGLSQALGDAAQERKGLPPAARRNQALRRALWLLGVAYGFRLAEYLLGGAWSRPDGWADLLKVDVLNVIAVGLAAAAVLSVGRPRRVAAALAGLAALAVVLATPVVADVLRHYDLPAGGGGGRACSAPRRTGSSTCCTRTSTRAGRARTSTCSTGSRSSSPVPRSRPSRSARTARCLARASPAALFGIAWWADTWPAGLRVPELLADLAVLVRDAARRSASR